LGTLRPLAALGSSTCNALISLIALRTLWALISLGTSADRALITLVALDPDNSLVSLISLGSGADRALISLVALDPGVALVALNSLSSASSSRRPLIALNTVSSWRSGTAAAAAARGHEAAGPTAAVSEWPGRLAVARDDKIEDLEKILTLNERVRKDDTTVLQQDRSVGLSLCHDGSLTMAARSSWP
jgi:hypothetical protein